MFTDKDFTMSLPLDRAALTRRANPSLASQAPIVRIIMHVDANDIDLTFRSNGTNNTSLRVTPSRAIKTINKWFCWVSSVINIMTGIKCEIVNKVNI